jgi:hypothetical protein
MVHILCHGLRGPDSTLLLLEDREGNADRVTTEQLVRTFNAVDRPPVFCFLAACESAARLRCDAFLPLGPALVEQGDVLAVVSMIDKVGLETAQLFARQFYSRLLAHGFVDLAMNEARAQVQDEWDWGVPVLYTRASNGQLLLPPDPDAFKPVRLDRPDRPPPPSSVEQLRRLEAAMPSKAKVGRRTEVRVTISRTDSPGLRAYLPDWTEAGDIITRQDVVEHEIVLAFPVDPVTTRPLPTQVYISLRAPDFLLEQDMKILRISPEHDAGIVTFFLTPQVSQERALVQVEVYEDRARTVLLSSLTLDTEVKAQRESLGRIAWQVIATPLSLIRRRAEATRSVSYPPPPDAEVAQPAESESAPEPRPQPESVPAPPRRQLGCLGALLVIWALALLLVNRV